MKTIAYTNNWDCDQAWSFWHEHGYWLYNSCLGTGLTSHDHHGYSHSGSSFVSTSSNGKMTVIVPAPHTLVLLLRFAGPHN